MLSGKQTFVSNKDDSLDATPSIGMPSPYEKRTDGRKLMAMLCRKLFDLAMILTFDL